MLLVGGGGGGAVRARVSLLSSRSFPLPRVVDSAGRSAAGQLLASLSRSCCLYALDVRSQIL